MAVKLFTLYSFLFLFGSSIPLSTATRTGSQSELAKHVETVATPILEVFQVYPPVLTLAANGSLEITDGSSNASVAFSSTHQDYCFQTLAVHSFAYSYGTPFVGSYNPPNCTFNRVTWNLTVTSSGTQYDRLGMVYLNSTEVFRTTTAEPTKAGIEWVYLKDMTSYLALFREPQTLIFELDNIVTDVYTGDFNVTLTASYFTALDSVEHADMILPVSAMKGGLNESSVFTVPSDTATRDLVLPRNTRRAVFSIAATGQSEEEFWWSNVPSGYEETFPQTGEFYGYSPFREVQLFIDGMLAGVAWPFPVIFTGGVVPGLWRPIVGIDAFDLKEDEIDITPWLPLLCDGQSHNFTIRVSGLSSGSNGTAVLSETTESYWLITGKVFIWLDSSGSITTGTTPIQNLPEPYFHVSAVVGSSSNGTNDTLVYKVDARRKLSISSTINTSNGSSKATWEQSLYFSNFGNITDQGDVQINDQHTSGVDMSSNGYSKTFHYPLWAWTAYYFETDSYTIDAIVNRGKDVRTIGKSVFPTGLESFAPVANLLPSFEGVWLSTSQNGSATYIANETTSTATGFGTTHQDMTLSGLEIDASKSSSGLPVINGSTELFHRNVLAVNTTIITDEEILVDQSVSPTHVEFEATQGYAAAGVKAMLGRGPDNAVHV